MPQTRLPPSPGLRWLWKPPSRGSRQLGHSGLLLHRRPSLDAIMHVALARTGALPLLSRARHASMVVAGGKPANQVQCTIALVKNIVGSGVLTLPAGISRLSDNGADSSESLGLAALFLLGFGVLNGLGFLLIGEACAATSQGSYVGAWRETIGKRTSFIPALSSLFLCFLAAVACASVIGDVATDILSGLLGQDYDSLSRNGVLTAISAAILTPLCLLPSLAPLGTASVLGVLGIVVTGGAMAVRFLDGSYAVDGAFATLTVAAPAFHEAAPGVSGVSTFRSEPAPPFAAVC